MTCFICFLSFLHLGYLRHRWNLTRLQLQPSGLSWKVGFLIDFPSNGEGWMIGNKHLHPLDMDLFPRTWNCRCLWVQMELFTSTHFHISSHTCSFIVVICTKMMMILDEAPNSSGPVQPNTSSRRVWETTNGKHSPVAIYATWPPFLHSLTGVSRASQAGRFVKVPRWHHDPGCDRGQAGQDRDRIFGQKRWMCRCMMDHRYQCSPK